MQGAAYIIDGDSLVIKKTQVRLFGIDAPELDHPYGKKAKWALLSLCKGQVIRAEVSATDTHGRTVAKCYLPDGRDLSAEMVKAGLAIDWPKFSGGVYSAQELPGIRKKLWLADDAKKDKYMFRHVLKYSRRLSLPISRRRVRKVKITKISLIFMLGRIYPSSITPP